MTQRGSGGKRIKAAEKNILDKAIKACFAIYL